MSEMVERVARALAKTHYSSAPDVFSNEIDGMVDRMWDVFVNGARAAIKAMREPTRPMYTLFDSECGDDPMVARGVAIDTWTRMIDTSLA